GVVAERYPVQLHRERPGGYIRPLAVGDMAAHGEQVADADDAGPGLLEVLQLAGHLLDRAAQGLAVAEDEVHRAERYGPGLGTGHTQAEGDGGAQREHDAGRPARRAADDGRSALAPEQVPRALVEPADGV